MRPEAVLDLVEAGRIPVISSVAPDVDGVVHNVNADTAAAALAIALGCREAARAHRRRGPLPRLARQRRRDRRDRSRGAGRADAHPGQRDGARRWPPASRPSRAASPAPPSSTAARTTPCCSSCSPTRASAPRCCPAWRPRSGRPRSSTSQQWQERYAGAVMNTFGPPKLVLVRGEGAHVWDADGKEYVDLLGGIAVNALGHAHPALVAAVTEQLTHPRPRLELLHQRAPGRAGRTAALARRRATAGCSSPTPAPRPTRRPSS